MNHVYVIGKNRFGELGLNHTLRVIQLREWRDENANISPININCGNQYTIFTDKNHNYWVIGCNQYGSCGIGYFCVSIPKCIEMTYFKENGIKIKKIFTNSSSQCTFWLSNTNKLYVNGEKENNYYAEPTLIEGVENIIDIKGGQYHHILLNSNGAVYATKYNQYSRYYGQNGHGLSNKDDNCKNDELQQIKTLENKKIIQIECGCLYSLFLDSNGMVWCCGYNDYKECGLEHNKTDKAMIPTPINYFQTNNIKIEQISCGGYHCLAINDKGMIWSWGSNNYRQCGHDNTAYINTPKLIKALKQYKITTIKCGKFHSYANNEYGEHFLFGYDKYNECSFSGDDKFNKYSSFSYKCNAKNVENVESEKSVPFCINSIFDKISNRKWIKEVYLGVCDTFIVTFNSVEVEHVLFGFIREIQQVLPDETHSFYIIPQSIYILCFKFICINQSN